jgi:hypothetical protein
MMWRFGQRRNDGSKKSVLVLLYAAQNQAASVAADSPVFEAIAESWNSHRSAPMSPYFPLHLSRYNELQTTTGSIESSLHLPYLAAMIIQHH